MFYFSYIVSVFLSCLLLLLIQSYSLGFSLCSLCINSLKLAAAQIGRTAGVSKVLPGLLASPVDVPGGWSVQQFQPHTGERGACAIPITMCNAMCIDRNAFEAEILLKLSF